MTTQALNSLSKASSAYLRSAMHQPIHWHEWGEEAFATAQRENKPMLLDIGAVWCHWCHVMDRESYDSAEIAQIINERFIAVKVDRDERPDIDSRYQVAISAITGQGGWPLTAFLTPDGKPFYGGTYFPPHDNYGRPSFKRVLLSIADAYGEKHGDVMEQVQMVEAALSQAESFTGKQGDFSPAVVDAIVESAVGMFDAENGGFGSAPKFPHAAAMDLIIDQYAHTNDERLRTVFVASLQAMAKGGVYDQLAGGFHRYSVDERWIVPHFEKMSYDNSELLKNYVHAYQATGTEFFADVARDIVRWVDEWLSDRQHGGFYASQDADLSMEDDGDYFTWTADEARAVLTADEFAAASQRYDIADTGEMHHNPAKNVLFVRASLKEIAKSMEQTEQAVQSLLHSAMKKMYTARLARPTPYVDRTIYVSWNALFVSAYLETAKVLDLADARHFALRSLDRILAEAWNPDRGLLHVIAYSDPKSDRREVRGGLEDYAFTAIACLDAYESTADRTYFQFAQKIGDQMIERFFDPAGGGFFDTEPVEGAKSLGVLGSRRKPFQDSPTPAGNSAAAIALLRLYGYTNDAAYRDQAERTLELLAGTAGRYGIFAGTYGIAAVHLSRPHTQVVVVGGDALADQLYEAAVRGMDLTKSVIRVAAGDAVAQKFPPALGETIPNLPAAKAAKSFAVVCANFTCQPPTGNPEELRKVLQAAENRKEG
jgi:hypothetical protein